MKLSICCNCRTELRPKTNGIYIRYLYNNGSKEIYNADLWYCPLCKHEIVLGIAAEPYPYEVKDSEVYLTVDIRGRKND